MLNVNAFSIAEVTEKNRSLPILELVFFYSSMIKRFVIERIAKLVKFLNNLMKNLK